LLKKWGKYVDESLTEKELYKLQESINRQSPNGARIWQMKVSKELGAESTLDHGQNQEERIEQG